MMELNDFLQYMVEQQASDLFLTTGAPASIKVNGQLKAIEEKPLPNGRTDELARATMNEEQQREFAASSEMNLALSITGVGRFRVNIFKQRDEIGLVIRHIKTVIPNLDVLGVPEIVKNLAKQKRGLVLFVGATGTGKSTSLASLVDYRNVQLPGHIITVEDPIEFVHSHKKSIVTQREVGVDTKTYSVALQNTLRQAPDVILIGEIRSQETMDHAITFSETGHLCFSTLHANNANQALERITNFFPEERHRQLLMDLSLNLRAIVSQRLIPTLNGGRVAAFEILLNTPLISDLIKHGDISGIKEIMHKSEKTGMQTFDTALYKLYDAGKISLQEALRNADSQNNLRLKIQLKEGVNEDSDEKLSIIKDDEKNPYHDLSRLRAYGGTQQPPPANEKPAS